MLLHSCFQLCSREATQPWGIGTGEGKRQKKKSGSKFPLLSSGLPASTEPSRALLPSASPSGERRAGKRGGWHPAPCCAGFSPLRQPLVLSPWAVAGNEPPASFLGSPSTHGVQHTVLCGMLQGRGAQGSPQAPGGEIGMHTDICHGGNKAKHAVIHRVFNVKP